MNDDQAHWLGQLKIGDPVIVEQSHVQPVTLSEVTGINRYRVLEIKGHTRRFVGGKMWGEMCSFKLREPTVAEMAGEIV